MFLNLQLALKTYLKFLEYSQSLLIVVDVTQLIIQISQRSKAIYK